jgi:thiosulfate/3-mercaptopyruvate sulfurtransferase
VAWLAQRLGQPAVVVVDCRYALEDPNRGRHAYAQGHIPGAVYWDLDQDLSGPKGDHGGRHPLPSPEDLACCMSRCGIGEGVHVVVYDQGGGYACRAWWLVRYLGHDQVSVLSGGFSAWVEAGLPVSQEVPAPKPRPFTPRVRRHWVVDVETVRRLPPGHVLVDARAPQRYRGEWEPLDPKAGHIPGAWSAFWEEGLDRQGRFLPPEEQRRRFDFLHPQAVVVSYCGSGVTACANLLALKLAGWPDERLRLYPGSFSDWASYPHLPVVTGPHPWPHESPRAGCGRPEAVADPRWEASG